ncbi:MAG: triose-phosphate isomerase [Aestuariivirgaceae bacterium]
MAGPKALVAGNWKMNGLTAELKEVRLLADMLKGVRLACDVMVCPPATLIRPVVQLLSNSRIKVGGQDCHAAAAGAFTGEISAEMLDDAGCTAVIVGHSERRTRYCETDAMVKDKAEAARRAGLTAIICIGETLEERESGRTLEVVSRQLAGSLPAGFASDDTVIAYEPVWAIGTGRTPTRDQVEEVHRHIRRDLIEKAGEEQGTGIRVLYGGSVKPENAAELLDADNVDGALVGGASLKAADFIGIIKAYA